MVALNVDVCDSLVLEIGVASLCWLRFDVIMVGREPCHVYVCLAEPYFESCVWPSIFEPRVVVVEFDLLWPDLDLVLFGCSQASYVMAEPYLTWMCLSEACAYGSRDLLWCCDDGGLAEALSLHVA